MTEIIKQLHELSVEFDCVFMPIWISTHDNIGADALSRNDLDRFQEWAKDNLRESPHHLTWALYKLLWQGDILNILPLVCVRHVRATRARVIKIELHAIC